MVHKGKKKFMKNAVKVENGEEPKPSKKAKIIVRNLPFKDLSEKTVEDFFSEYGDIEEVKLLKKEDGKFVGCGFVQFKKVSSAAKAIRHANQKEMNGRKIVVDWALPKNTYLEKVQKLNGNPESINIKTEVLSDEEPIEFEIDKKPDVISDDENSDTDDSDAEESDHSANEDEEMDVSYDDDSDSDEDDGFNVDVKSEKKFKYDENGKEMNMANNMKREKPSDVEEGKTIFIRNIPFSATNEDLKNCFESHGALEYALICVDKLTEHSKGTGFVKFKDKESATQCIKNSTKICIGDNPLIITMALSKQNLENKAKSKKTVKDSRNLYLMREGTIIAGSKAAVGVSAGDMAKRLQLEQWKNQILKNLNMFVSRTRLVIHNLPPSYDDSKLRDLFRKYSNPKAVIKEAKVMYDKKSFDSSGKNISKEVGFVSFTNHEDALEALRNINNNPNIFTPKKRPIVAFSIENKAVINSKLKRIEKSRAKLGIDDKSEKFSKLNKKQRRFLKRREKFIERRKELKKSKETPISDDLEGERCSKKNSKEFVKKIENNDSMETNEEPEQKPFAGVISESGKKIKLRSKFRLKTQANIHSQTLKKERRKKREMERKKMGLHKTQKQKKGKSKLADDAALSKLLKKHRESIQESSVVKKWYNK